MSIKKYKISKRLSKKISKSKRLHKNLSKSKRVSKRVSKLYKSKRVNQKGGFLNNPSCNIATIKEPGFNISGLGTSNNSIPGLSIPDSRAVIYNPNCKTDTYQAMV